MEWNEWFPSDANSCHGWLALYYVTLRCCICIFASAFSWFSALIHGRCGFGFFREFVLLQLWMGVGWIVLSFSFSGMKRRKLVWEMMERIEEDNESKAKKAKLLRLIDWMYNRLGYSGTEYGRVGPQQDQQYCSIIYDWMYQKHRSLQLHHHPDVLYSAHPTSASAEVNQPGAYPNRISICILHI